MKRTMKRPYYIFIPLFILCITLFGAFILQRNIHPPKPAVESLPQLSSGRILIAYYSQTGHSAAVAKAIQQEVGGDVYHIQATTTYPQSAPAMLSQVKKEQNERIIPDLASPVPDLSQYDVIILGFPNWYDTAPMAVFTFLRNPELQGKIIIPYITYGLSGSGFSEDDIRQATRGSIVLPILSIHASQTKQPQSIIRPWLTSLGLLNKEGHL